MHIKRLILIAVFILFPFAQVVFVASPAEAACCRCGVCAWYCTCPGQSYCDWCASPQTDSELDLSLPFEDSPGADVDIRGVRASMLSSANERILTNIDRNNNRKAIIMRLLENVQSELKPWCPNAHDKNQDPTAMDLQVNAQANP